MQVSSTSQSLNNNQPNFTGKCLLTRKTSLEALSRMHHVKSYKAQNDFVEFAKNAPRISEREFSLNGFLGLVKDVGKGLAKLGKILYHKISSRLIY